MMINQICISVVLKESVVDFTKNYMIHTAYIRLLIVNKRQKEEMLRYDA